MSSKGKKRPICSLCYKFLNHPELECIKGHVINHHLLPTIIQFPKAEIYICGREPLADGKEGRIQLRECTQDSKSGEVVASNNPIPKPKQMTRSERNTRAKKAGSSGPNSEPSRGGGPKPNPTSTCPPLPEDETLGQKDLS